jgi:DNA-directed RNA polymerase subunit M/transcription elongation factor TFIIS
MRCRFIMKRCIYCGRENPKDNRYCAYCGEELNSSSYHQNDGPDVEVMDEAPESTSFNNNIKCPNCGSEKIYLRTRESGGFDTSNACCGYILLGPLGLLCGLASDRESITVRKCKNCGHEF